MELGDQRHAPAALPPGRRSGTRYTGGWVRPQGRSVRVRKISPPPRLDPQTIQPAARVAIPTTLTRSTGNSIPRCFLVRISNITCSRTRDPV